MKIWIFGADSLYVHVADCPAVPRPGDTVHWMEAKPEPLGNERHIGIVARVDWFMDEECEVHLHLEGEPE